MAGHAGSKQEQSDEAQAEKDARRAVQGGFSHHVALKTDLHGVIMDSQIFNPSA